MNGGQVQATRLHQRGTLQHDGLFHRIVRNGCLPHRYAFLLHPRRKMIGTRAQTLIKRKTNTEFSLHREIGTNDVFLECHPQFVCHAM